MTQKSTTLEGWNNKVSQSPLFMGGAVLLGILLGIWGFLYPSYLTLIIPVLLIGLTVLLIRPDWAYLLAVASLPVLGLYYVIPVSSKGIPVAVYPLYILIIPTLAGWFLWRCARLAPPAKPSGCEGPLFCLGGLTAISLLWAPVHNFSRWQVLMLFVNMSIFLSAGFYIQDRKMLSRVFNVLVVMGVVASLFALLSKFIGYHSQSLFPETGQTFKAILYTGIASPGQNGSTGMSGRAGGLDIHNHIATYLNFYIFLTFALFWNQKDRNRRIILGSSLGLMLIAHLMTYSRGGLLGLMGGIFVFMLLQPEFRKNFIKYSSYAFIVLVVLFILIYGKNFGQALQRITAVFGETGVSGTSSRKEIWLDGFKLLKESPLLGAGIGGFRTIYHHPHAHNIYFSVLFDLGLIGFMILGWFISRLVRIVHLSLATIRQAEDLMMARAFTGALVAFSIHALVDFDFTWVQFIWGILGIGLAMLRLSREEATSSPFSDSPAN